MHRFLELNFLKSIVIYFMNFGFILKNPGENT